MKKIYSLLIFGLSSILASNAQCVIDGNNNTIGASPKDLGSVCVDKPVNQVVQIAIPNDTVIYFGGFNIPLQFDSILVTVDPNTIPAGMSYNCANGCKFYRTGTIGELSRGCINLKGTPTTSTGTDDVMSINAHVWFSNGGIPQEYNWPYDISINILPANDPSCVLGLESFAIGKALSIFPNPSKGNAFLKLELPSSTNVKIDVYDVLGNNVGKLYNGNMGQGANQISMSSLNLLENGMYMVKVELESKKGTRTYTERMIVR